GYIASTLTLARIDPATRLFTMAELTAKALVIHPRPKEMQGESGARRGSLWMILATRKASRHMLEFLKRDCKISDDGCIRLPKRRSGPRCLSRSSKR
ncbi:MAG: hypothetical protein WCC94_06120, partial [Candidatus Bathyarchaeia archaeon]